MSQTSQKTFTIFCRQANGKGTTNIFAVQADDLESATQSGIEQCAEDWACDESSIHILGVAEGDVTILEWNDQAA